MDEIIGYDPSHEQVRDAKNAGYERHREDYDEACLLSLDWKRMGTVSHRTQNRKTVTI